jgi:hypothetical protein
MDLSKLGRSNVLVTCWHPKKKIHFRQYQNSIKPDYIITPIINQRKPKACPGAASEPPTCPKTGYPGAFFTV